MSPMVFARTEEKYLISWPKADALISSLGTALIGDEHGESRIRSLYLDTPEHLLVRRSMEKPRYKEKLRVRTYGDVKDGNHLAYFELKKKFEGQVYKRRARMTLAQAQQFAEDKAGVEANQGDPLEQQICRELAWTLERYGELAPFMSIQYQRHAFTYRGASENADVRITLDLDTVWASGSWESFLWTPNDTRLTQLLPPDIGIMEIKALGGLPLELTGALAALNVFPVSYSKIGRAYEASMIGIQ